MAEEARRLSGRRVASLVLVVVGTVLLFVGGIALYAREEVFDPDAFAQHASESLGDDRVDAAVANPIVDQVIKAGPDELINARPLLTAGVRGVLASESFRDDTHPDESLIIVIEDYVAPEDIERASQDSGLVRYAYVHDRNAPFPTLRELIESDKRILVMAENDNGGGSIPWYHDGFELMQETPYTFKSADELRDPKSCRQNRGTADGPLFQFNHWVEKVPRSPDLGAQVNSYDFMVRRARECRRRRGLLPNLLAVDFYDEGDVFEVARKLNRLPRDAEPQVRETG